jgi:hypothetical protein
VLWRVRVLLLCCRLLLLLLSLSLCLGALSTSVSEQKFKTNARKK